jgi:hypothetical protein
MKTVSKTYLEDVKTKEWFDKNLKPQHQSQFIREATRSAIEDIKRSKQKKS